MLPLRQWEIWVRDYFGRLSVWSTWWVNWGILKLLKVTFEIFKLWKFCFKEIQSGHLEATRLLDDTDEIPGRGSDFFSPRARGILNITVNCLFCGVTEQRKDSNATRAHLISHISNFVTPIFLITSLTYVLVKDCLRRVKDCLSSFWLPIYNKTE